MDTKTTKKKPETKPKPELPTPFGLVGRCFHTFDAKGYVECQGIVRGELGGGKYLVQYFEWLMGEASTLSIRDINEMKPGRGEGCWQFYEDAEHMNFWYEYRAQRRPKSVALNVDED